MTSVQIDSTTGSEIVATSEIKSYARIETSSDDSIVTILQKASREACEDYINRDIVAKTRTYFRSEIPLSSGDYTGLYQNNYKIVLPYAPISSITSVEREKSDNTFTAVSYEEYGKDDKYILLKGSNHKNIKIVYATSGLTNDSLKLAILQLAATYYDNRSDFVAGNVNEIPTSIQNILDPYKYISDI
tara:strand:+ start:8766 stop:9329 length:564 start_codon:yes stop_codon:yes gene_type:complete